MLKLNDLMDETTLMQEARISRSTAYRWRRAGLLPHYIIGRSVLYPRTAVRDLLDASLRKAAARPKR